MRATKRPALHVLVVDDSAVVRQIATAILEREGDIAVSVAPDPFIAIDKMNRSRPDVIVLDIEMPRMDGLTFLGKIMREDPIPVVVLSGIAARGTQTALRALDEGAVQIVPKPRIGVRNFLEESAAYLVETIREASKVVPRRRRINNGSANEFAGLDSVIPPVRQTKRMAASNKVVAIGCSTGGTEALKVFLDAIPEDAPGIVVVQHMPEVFTAAFAKRLDETARVAVQEAADGHEVTTGRAFIAPGNRHTLVLRTASGYRIHVTDGPKVSRHRPSVDVLFRSMAQAAGPNAIGVILTGMGSDGSAGLLEMKRAGAVTIAQDETTSAVFGMPKEAIAVGAVDHVLPLEAISAAVLQHLSD